VFNLNGRYIFVALICILTLTLFASTVFAGIWVEPSVSANSSCAGFSHTMCAEFGPSYVPGIGNDGLISYSNESGAFKTDEYCAITYDPSGGAYGFTVINGSTENIDNISDLKSSSLLGDEVKISVIYDNVTARHYDENCNADEMFERSVDNTLNLSRYIENNVTYDVAINPFAEFENLDTFDLLARNGTGELLDLGTYMNGTAIDTQTNLPVSGVNITLYFSNPYGTLIPYISFISDAEGKFNTLFVSRNITSYFGTYEEVSRIPITSYIVVAQHPGYETSTTEVITTGSPASFTINLDPFSICQPDCTYQTDSTCHATCNGINDCGFPVLEFDTSYDLVGIINGRTSGSEYGFVYNGSKLAYNGTAYAGVACEPMPVPISSSSFEGNSKCGPDQNTWKTERIVNLKGKLVRMFITYCE
jgi:hypothetical protein